MPTAKLTMLSARLRVVFWLVALMPSYELTRAQLPMQNVGGSSTLDTPPNTSGANAIPGRHRLNSLTAVPEDFSTLKLSPGFLLSMDVFDAPEFSTDLRINSNGEVSVPTVGLVHIGGDTLTEAAATISKHLDDMSILNHPQITLNILQYTGQSVTVLGEVHNPGRLELLGTHTLAEVIAMSGGETQYVGNTIEIRHAASSPRLEFIHINKDSSDETLTTVQVHPGDMVNIQRAGIVYVLGGVNRPGGYIMQENGSLDLLQALALAYGTTLDAAVGSINLIRKVGDGKVQRISVPYRAIVKGKESAPRLQAEDVIYVPISKTKTVLGAGLLSATTQAAIYAR